MKKNSPQNFDCEFAPEVVDFLYGEMNGDRKNSFGLHLSECSNCAAEVEDFSGLRFSIQDWKIAEFDKIPTPEISIPYEIAAITDLKPEKSVSWFDVLKNYLTISPVMSGTAAVLVLAFLFGFGFFALKDNEKTLTAETNVKPKSKDKNEVVTQKTDETEIAETIPKPENFENGKQSDINETKEKKHRVEKTAPSYANSKNISKPKIQSVKTSERNPVPNVSLIATKNTKTVTNKNKPRLNELPEENEDNSLRLTDLFAELDSRK